VRTATVRNGAWEGDGNAVTTCEPGYLTLGLSAVVSPECERGRAFFQRRVSTPERSLVASRLVRLTLAFFSVLLLSLAADAAVVSTAADAGTVSGRVLDPDGRPVPGATVLVVAEGQPLLTTTTNGRGEFAIDAPDGIRADIRVALAGFRSRTLTVDATGARDLGEIKLEIGAVFEGVVVSAAQVEIPLSEAASSVTVLSAAELQASQVRTVADALRTVPGMAVVTTGGHGAVTGVFPRGGESNFTLVMVDDVPVNAFGGEYDFGNLSTENVERIEIVRGPQSALFGSNAIGSVVRIVTRKGGAPAVSATIEGGGYDTVRTAAATSGSAGRFEWGASAERMGSDGFNGRQTSDGLTVANDDYERIAGGLVAGWRAGRATLRGQFRQENDERGTPGPFGTNPIGAYGGIDTISRGTNDQTTGSFSASVPLSPRVRTLFQAGYYSLRSDFASPDFFIPGAVSETESSSRRVSGRAQVDISLTPTLGLTGGAEFQAERATSTFITGPSFTPVPVKRRLAGYYSELRWNHERRVLVTGGLRIDDIDREPLPGATPDDDRVVSVNPRLAVAWIVEPGAANLTKVRASAATGIRPPGAFEIAFTSNPALKPERSVSGEAGIEQGFAGGRARVDAVAFYNRYDDLIVAVGSFGGSSRYTTDNISNARARGIELAVDAGHRVFSSRPLDLHARVAYTFIDSDVLAVDGDEQAPPPFAVGDPLLRRPRHQFSAEVTGRVGAVTAFISGRARGQVLDVEPSLGTFGGLHYADGFTVWNSGLTYRVARRVELFGRVENLFDRTYEEALGFPALGRRATLGLRVAAGR
jgi:outer membrane cobalamin receptor